jgi:hypothetical protein
VPLIDEPGGAMPTTSTCWFICDRFTDEPRGA